MAGMFGRKKPYEISEGPETYRTPGFGDGLPGGNPIAWP